MGHFFSLCSISIDMAHAGESNTYSIKKFARFVPFSQLLIALVLRITYEV